MKSVVLLLALTVSVSADEADLNCADVRAVAQAIGRSEAFRMPGEEWHRLCVKCLSYHRRVLDYRVPG
jgi:hypothetical protein